MTAESVTFTPYIWKSRSYEPLSPGTLNPDGSTIIDDPIRKLTVRGQPRYDLLICETYRTLREKGLSCEGCVLYGDPNTCKVDRRIKGSTVK
jgi:hypothetical protein